MFGESGPPLSSAAMIVEAYGKLSGRGEGRLTREQTHLMTFPGPLRIKTTLRPPGKETPSPVSL